jgi:hypothetical protein
MSKSARAAQAAAQRGADSVGRGLRVHGSTSARALTRVGCEHGAGSG